MATIKSAPIQLAIKAKEAASPPVDEGFPPPGFALMVAPAGAWKDACPKGMAVDLFGYALFGSFGSGLQNPFAGLAGAYQVAGSGGHGHPSFMGIVSFYWDTFSYEYRPCANPGIPDFRNGGVDRKLTNDSPWFEFLASAEAPAPAHPYGNLQYIPPKLNGGEHGSLIYLDRSSVDSNGGASSPTAHEINVDEAIWRRAAEEPGGFTSFEQATVYDDVTGRYYVIPPDLQYTRSLRYLDGQTRKWGNTPTFKGGKYGPAVSSGNSNCPWLQGRYIMLARGKQFFGISLDTPENGWVAVRYSGDSIINDHSKPVFHVKHGIAYRRHTKGEGNKLHRFIPPDDGDLLVSEWRLDTVEIAGDVIAEYPANPYMTTSAYRNLVYIDQYEVLGWVTPNGSFLINPPSPGGDFSPVDPVDPDPVDPDPVVPPDPEEARREKIILIIEEIKSSFDALVELIFEKR